MARYNIYKLIKDQEDALIEKLCSVGLSLTRCIELNQFKLSFYLSESPDDIDIWWTELFSSYLQGHTHPKNKSYFALFLISNSTLLYAISLGKTHFYLKDFCDVNFGIDLAQRIADERHLRLKHSKLFGGKRNKTIISYMNNSSLEYDSGESVNYLKAKTINKDKWGDVCSFGHSVMMHIEKSPDQLPDLVQDIEEVLTQEENFIIPRSVIVKEHEKKRELDRRLASEILSYNANIEVHPTETVMSGVDFIFTEQNSYSFIWNHDQQTSQQNEITIEKLKEFILQNSIDLCDEINNIKIKVHSENSKSYIKSLKYFLDYVDDERYFLLEGKWHKFNQNYIEYLKKQVDERIEFETCNIDFSNSDYRQYIERNNNSDRNVYPEFWFNTLREQDGYVNFDRNIEILQSHYKIEKMDLYKDNMLFFVKIGKPQKLGYTIDQSTATVKIIQNNTSTIEIDGSIIRPEKICLWFILERQRIDRLSDIKSLIFLMKLSEWQRQCVNAGFKAVVRISYRL